MSLKFEVLNLATLAGFTAAQITKAAKAELSAIDATVNKRLPYLGALRHFAKVRETSLADLVATYGSATRKAFEDSKPYADILAFFGASTIPDKAFDAIKRAEARDLVAVLPALKKDTAALEAVQKYLSAPVNKWRPGWVAHVVSLCPKAKEETPAPAPAPEVETPAAPAPEGTQTAASAPAPEVEPPAANVITALPSPAPMTPAELVALVKEKMRGMSDKNREIARSMLASLVNSPEKLPQYLAAA
jgi:hypothetical protein